MKRFRGFTLLELLMVVIIIAILAAVALPQYIRATERARASQAISWLGAMRSAELRYAALAPANIFTANCGASCGGGANDLDIDVPLPPNWNTPAFALTAGAGGANPTGFVTLQRAAGQFAAQTMGIQFGSGTICGTFTVYDAGLAACEAD